MTYHIITKGRRSIFETDYFYVLTVYYPQFHSVFYIKRMANYEIDCYNKIPSNLLENKLILVNFPSDKNLNKAIRYLLNNNIISKISNEYPDLYELTPTSLLELI